MLDLTPEQHLEAIFSFVKAQAVDPRSAVIRRFICTGCGARSWPLYGTFDLIETNAIYCPPCAIEFSIYVMHKERMEAGCQD